MKRIITTPVSLIKGISVQGIKNLLSPLVVLFKNLNLPNQIAVLRALSVIPIGCLILWQKEFLTYLAFGLFAIAAISDFVDGYIARKRGLITDFGKVTDHIADKLLVFITLAALLSIGSVGFWVFALLLARDLSISVVRDLASSKGVIMPANIWGKVKTTLQMTGIGLVIINTSIFGQSTMIIGTILLYAAIVVAWYSFYTYCVQYLAMKDQHQ